MAIKTEMLRCFTTVAQTGNLADAAARLGRTQSAVSMTLKQFEDHLGQRLFESDRKNRLSVLGEQVLELAQSQLRQFDTTVQAIETAARAPRGLIRIVSVPSVAGLVFPGVIMDVTRRFPGLRIELRDADTGAVINALMQGQADLGVASGRPTVNGMRATRLFSDRFGLLCAAGHPLIAQRAAPTLEQVAEAGFVMNNLCSLIETPAFFDATAETRVTLHNTLSLIGMVRGGDWVTVLPETVARVMPAELAFRPIADLPDRRDVSLLLREKSPVLSFAEAIERQLQSHEWGHVQG